MTSVFTPVFPVFIAERNPKNSSLISELIIYARSLGMRVDEEGKEPGRLVVFFLQEKQEQPGHFLFNPPLRINQLGDFHVVAANAYGPTPMGDAVWETVAFDSGGGAASNNLPDTAVSNERYEQGVRTLVYCMQSIICVEFTGRPATNRQGLTRFLTDVEAHEYRLQKTADGVKMTKEAMDLNNLHQEAFVDDFEPALLGVAEKYQDVFDGAIHRPNAR